MNTTTPVISPVHQRMIEDMRMRKLAPKTHISYIRAVRHFAGYLGRSPDTASAEDLRRYQLHCVDRGVTPITLNATTTGLKFFRYATPKEYSGQDATFRYCVAIGIVFAIIIQSA